MHSFLLRKILQTYEGSCFKTPGLSPRTRKQVKGTLSTSVREYMLNCNHVVAWEDFSIFGRESNHYLLEIKDSLVIKRDNSSLNWNKYSQELFLF